MANNAFPCAVGAGLVVFMLVFVGWHLIMRYEAWRWEYQPLTEEQLAERSEMLREYHEWMAGYYERKRQWCDEHGNVPYHHDANVDSLAGIREYLRE